MIRNQYGNGTDAVLDYFENNYVGRFCVYAARGIPTFKIDFCNAFAMFHCTDDKILRINNAVEG